MTDSGEQNLRQVQEIVTKQLKATADQVRKEITQELDQRLTEALEKQSTMVGIEFIFWSIGIGVLLGVFIGILLGRNF